MQAARARAIPLVAVDLDPTDSTFNEAPCRLVGRPQYGLAEVVIPEPIELLLRFVGHEYPRALEAPRDSGYQLLGPSA